MDISTSCTGICLLGDDGSFRSVCHVDLKKEKNFYKKVDMVIETLIATLQDTKEEFKFYVEAPLLVFKMKASMASTIALLQRFNSAVCYAIYSKWNIEPKHISVLSARKTVGLTLPKKKKKKEIKPLVFQFVKSLSVIPDSHWVYKRTGTPKDFCYDECDALVIARAAYLLKDEKNN